MIGDARLRALYRLADRVDGAAFARVQTAIRERRQELEREGDRIWEPPADPDYAPAEEHAAAAS